MLDFLPFSRPSLGEEEIAAVNTVMLSGWITSGPKNQQLEAAFCGLTGNKHAIAVSSATGGMHVTDDDQLAERIRSLKFHGLGVNAYDRLAQGRAPQAEVIIPGYEYNLSDIYASIALVQCGKLAHVNQRRQEIAQRYLSALADTPLLPLRQPEWPHRHAWHLFILRVGAERCGISRDALMAALQAQRIGTGLYFRAVHTQTYYRERFPALELTHTEWNSERLLSIPLFPDMTYDDTSRVIDALSAVCWHVRGG